MRTRDERTLFEDIRLPTLENAKQDGIIPTPAETKWCN